MIRKLQMAKNKNKVAKSNDNTANGGLNAEESAKLMQLEQELEAMRKVKAEREAAAIETLKASIDALPTSLGVADLNAVINLIKTHQKGMIGAAKKVSLGRGRRIDAETKVKIDADVKAEVDTVASIAERYGVSSQYVQGRRKALGLTAARATVAS